MSNITDNPKIQVLKAGCSGIFTNYIYKAIPLAFDESMSYYETLAGLRAYLKDVILPTVNGNAEAVAELQELYIQLNDYVTNYFDNLDVQEEINNKLDEMVEDGTLPEIIASYLNSKAVFGFDNVELMKQATNLINGSFAQTLGYHTKNDDGKALYKIRNITNDDVVDERKIIALNNNNLIAELIVNNKINVKQIGAYGNDTNDDTEILQYAINNFDNVYIPKGTYKITNQLNLKSNLHLSGDGATSILKSYFTYNNNNNNNNINYIFVSDSSSVSITRTIIEKLKFENHDVNTLAGGIYVEFSTRGLVLNNLWFEKISNCINLGQKIWGIATLTNIFSTYLADNLDENLKNLAYGIYAKGNTIFGKNIEIIGTFHYGILLEGCKVSDFKDLNIAGSTTTYMMKNAIKIINSNDIKIDSVWMEELADGSGVLTKSVEIADSNQVSLSNLHIASGSMFVDNSKNVKLENCRYYTTNAGLRYLNNSNINTDSISLGYCNYQSNENYNMGIVNVTDIKNESNSNILNNPLYFLGIAENLAVTNGTFVTKTSNTTDQLTGDRCFNFETSNNQGATINTSNILTKDKIYTILAYIKCINNIDKIHITNTGAATVTNYPNEFYKNDDDGEYHLIRKTIKIAEDTSSIRFIANLLDNNIKGNFIIDSIFIVEGIHNNDIPSAISKDGILLNSKVKASTSPYSGTWKKGDTIYNNFNNSANDNIIKWVYNGTTWTPINFA